VVKAVLKVNEENMDRSATVVRIIARLNVGGPAIHTILLTSRLQTDRYSSILVKGVEAPDEGDLMALAEQERVHPVVIPQLGRELRVFDDLVAFLKLTRFIWRKQPAIVHTHTSKAGTLGRLAVVVANLGRMAQRLFSRRAARPIRSVHTYHGHIFHGYFSPIKTRIFLAIERLLARLTDAIIVISPRQQKEIVKTYRIADGERVRTIPLGLELTPFSNSKSRQGKLRAELGIDDDRPLMGIVGRLVPVKRHDVLFRALSLLKSSSEANANFCCVVVGDGELRHGLGGRILGPGLLGFDLRQ
jgi:glycosyltransferase involved in cell wall biosynthesis